ncbi:MAG: hypothetical protein A2341_19840 [Deltaproteobacteria bacterium RIFOXYB12_FULL_58_9]|nr:MAG: hypothetical protein A2341_19840 [Deltaproteobacteria bacterium RIFOXYB12_FULL_58_9]
MDINEGADPNRSRLMRNSMAVRACALAFIFACTSPPKSAAPIAGAIDLPLPSSSHEIEPAPFVTASRPQCVDVAVNVEMPKPFEASRRSVAVPSSSQSSSAGDGGGGYGAPGLGTLGASMAGESEAMAMEDTAAEPAPEPTAQPSASPPPPASKSAKAANKMAKPAKAPAKNKSPSQKEVAESVMAEADADGELSQGAANDTETRKKPEQPSPPVEKSQPEEDFPTEPTTKYLSADDSNSMASPTIVRKLITSRRYVHPDYIRTYEFLNYYTFNYPSPTTAEIAVLPEMRAGDRPGTYNMQVAVRSADRERAQMLPLNLVVLLDVSGSMAGEPFSLATTFITELAKKLRPGEVISLVTVSREASTVLDGHVVTGDTPEQLEKLLKAITPTDITNFEAGLAMAYNVVEKNYQAKHANRVVVVSDGGANTGKLTKETIAKHAEDSNRQGIYLVGVAVGEGFDDMLMDAVTDKGRGAYIFLDRREEILRIMAEENFVSTFDLSIKDVRLKLVLPPGWKVREFHGEQMSSVASEVIPQYLAPSDQMLYHLEIATNHDGAALKSSSFELEAEYRPIGSPKQTLKVQSTAGTMLKSNFGLLKGDAIVRYAETFKKITYPLEDNRDANVRALDESILYVASIYDELRDRELRDIIALMKAYRRTLVEGEDSMFACDRNIESPAVVLGIRPEFVSRAIIRGPAPAQAIKAVERLGSSTRLLPLEGRRFLALGSGPIGNTQTTSGQLSAQAFADPEPRFMGNDEHPNLDHKQVFDLHQVVLELQAPPEAKSLSFDLNYFSAEYPEYVKASYNDTFYAVLEAASTNDGKPTNISFDPNKRSIEVDNNYFENEFHPIPNTGTGFDNDGSTGWLRTSWPIQGGERFTLTFSIHDEGDAIYDSVVLLDNFMFSSHSAVGNTDPLN